MKKHEVDIVDLQFAHRFEHRFFAFLVPVMLYPHLGGDKELFAGYARFFDCLADLRFVEVRLRRVDMAVADLERVRNAPLALLPRHLIHAVAELGHFYTVRKRYIFHKDKPPFDLRLYYSAPRFKRE